MISIDWDPSINNNGLINTKLSCIQSGCHAIAQFNVLKPEQCTVPKLSLNFF